jgi:two-component system OmpR family sensor kinase
MMRLNYKYTFAYSLITLIILFISFAIVYTAVKRATAQATIGQLKHLNDIVAVQIQNDKYFYKHLSSKKISIEAVSSADVPESENVEFETVWDKEFQDNVTDVSVSTVHKIKNKFYRITSHTFMIIADDIYLNGIFMVFAWTFIFLIAVVIISSEVISAYILSPFNSTLRSIQKFSVYQKTDIELEKTSTLEFQELNGFLLKMTENAKKDYSALKEFSENASHELQTPIAVIKAKIELLIQTNLDEQQLLKLTSMLDELEKLSMINHSLTLLAKLENFENHENNLINVSSILDETIMSFSDLIEMKNISLVKDIQEDVFIAMDETLSRILLKNLLSNAIRHNLYNGTISITLTSYNLIIENTGNKPLVPTSELFGRFKKGNQSLSSIGIGLAIVKKICDVFNYTIDYNYLSPNHTIEIIFSTKGR